MTSIILDSKNRVRDDISKPKRVLLSHNAGINLAEGWKLNRSHPL